MDARAPPPTPPSERIFALDTIRGCAVLGILLMNILGMGLTGPAYELPTAEVGGNTGANLWAWIAEMFYFEGTMRGLFTLLFGAGAVLYTSRLERAGVGLRVADLYMRRNLWLAVFGLFNAWILLWFGDILFFYGLTALLLFVFRNLPVRALMLWALLFLCVQPAVGARDYFAFKDVQAAAPALLKLEKAKAKMTDAQTAQLQRYHDYSDPPDKVKIAKAMHRMNTGYATAAGRVRERAWRAETQFFPESALWEVLGMMLLGMALFKSGGLTLGWSTRAYVTMLVAGYGVGLSVNTWEILHVMRNDFEPAAALLPWTLTYDLGRIPTTFGHVALAMLLVRSGWFRGLLERLAATGRMALTNYLMQSAIALFLFTGLGLGLFGKLQRYELYYVVFAVWALELLWSPWWLARFQYGPMEWLWRTLTRWELQPMRRDTSAPMAVAAEG